MDTSLEYVEAVRENLAHVLDLPWDEVVHQAMIAPVHHGGVLDAMAKVEGNGHTPETIWCHPVDAVDFRKWDKLTSGWVPEFRREFLDLGLVGTFWTRTLVMSDHQIPQGFIYVVGKKGLGGFLEDLWGRDQLACITVMR